MFKFIYEYVMRCWVNTGEYVYVVWDCSFCNYCSLFFVWNKLIHSNSFFFNAFWLVLPLLLVTWRLCPVCVITHHLFSFVITMCIFIWVSCQFFITLPVSFPGCLDLDWCHIQFLKCLEFCLDLLFDCFVHQHYNAFCYIFCLFCSFASF